MKLLKEYTFDEYNRQGEKINTFKIVASSYKQAEEELSKKSEYSYGSLEYYVILSEIKKLSSTYK